MKFKQYFILDMILGSYHYNVKINGDEAKNVVNSRVELLEDVKVFAGDKFHPAADATYKNLIWESKGNRKTFLSFDQTF